MLPERSAEVVMMRFWRSARDSSMTRPLVRKTIFLLSGENAEPFTPLSEDSIASAPSSGRTRMRRAPPFTPVIATKRPSGEIEKPLSSDGTGSTSPGNTTSSCSTCLVSFVGAPRVTSAQAATATAAAVRSHGSPRASAAPRGPRPRPAP